MTGLVVWFVVCILLPTLFVVWRHHLFVSYLAKPEPRHADQTAWPYRLWRSRRDLFASYRSDARERVIPDGIAR